MSVKWTQYEVEITFRDRLIGGIPVVREEDRLDSYEQWARGQGVKPSDAGDLAEMLAAENDMPVAVEKVEGLETGFRRDDDGLYIEARQVKAMLREATTRLGLTTQRKGVRQVIQHDLLVRAPNGGQKLHLGVIEPDGRDMRPISVVTRQGPRTALKKFEYVTQRSLRFTVRILEGGPGEGKIGTEQLSDMLELGGDLGLGADRSQGEGTFDVTAFDQLGKD